MLISSILLLESAFAGRLDTIARNKGFHPNAIWDLQARAERARAPQEKIKTRYLNSNTQST